MKRFIIAGAAVVVLVVGFVLFKKHPAPPAPPPSAAATAESAAPAEAPPASETITYNIQLCVVGKATIAIDTDKITWNGTPLQGPPTDDCSGDMQGKILVKTMHNDVDAWTDALTMTTPNDRLGPIKVALPGKELASPPTLDVLAGKGTVTLTQTPAYPRYRAEISFDEPSTFAHIYDVALTLRFK